MTDDEPLDPFEQWVDDDGDADRRDDPDEVTASTPMARLRDRAGRVLAVVVAITMVLPITAWAVDTYVFAALGEDVAEAAPELADAVVLVGRRGCDGTRGTGSGFAVDVDGAPAVVTNRHVVEGSASVGVRTLDGDTGPAVVEVLLSTVDDVAVLLLEAPLAGTIGLGDRPREGDELRLVGFPGARPVTSAGRVADVDDRRVLLDLRADPGASGAPLVDDDGRVAAQVVARTEDGDAVAIPVDVVAAAIGRTVPAPDC